MTDHEHHIVDTRLYFIVFGALMVMTFITVMVAFFNLGHLNNIVMLSIAIFKATLVVSIFMHLKYNARILWVAAAGAGLWLLVMLSLTLCDLLSRGWAANPPQGWL